MEDKLNEVQTGYDSNIDKIKSLENWIDIYMPLKLQHQISQTIKECLSTRKAKHLLGVVNNLICDQLRLKVFKDIGVPSLLKNCISLIDKLKLEADVLTKEGQEEL